MVRRVQHASPEDPYSLPANIKERHHFQPPGFVPSRHSLQPWLAQLFIPLAETGWGKLLGHQSARLGFTGKANEFGKKPSLGKQLVFHDVQHAAGALRWLERHVLRTKRAPHAHHLARFAGVGIQQVLEDRVSSTGHRRLRDRGVFILHWHVRFPPAGLPRETYPAIAILLAVADGFTMAATTSPPQTNPIAMMEQ